MATQGDMDHIEQVLNCQICLNPLVNRKARMLTCLHTFCETCLESIHKEQPGRTIACSICRQTTELPRGLVSDLPINFNINQTHSLVETLVETTLCPKCCQKGEYIRATLKCITCRWNMCNTCREMHDKLPGFARHQVENIEPEQDDNTEPTCSIHTSSARLICRNCKLLLCTQCLIEDPYDIHTNDLQNIDDALTEMQVLFAGKEKVLTDDVEYVKKEIEANDKQRQYLSNVEKEITQAAESVKSHIDKNAKELINELKENFIRKLEDRSIRLNEALKRGTACLKLTEELQDDPLMHVLEKSESWDQDTLELERLITELRESVVIPMVKFTPRCEVTTIGSLDQTELLLPDPRRRDLLTPDDLRKLSEQLGKPYTVKPKLNKRLKKLPVDLSRDVVALDDGSALFVRKSHDEILRIDCEGKILSRFKPDGCGKILSISAFSKKIICICKDRDQFIELELNSEELSLSNSRSKHGIKADGVCVDCSGNIILYDEKTVTKLDYWDNIVWQKTVTEECHRVKSGLLDNKHCYLVNYFLAEKTEIWNEAGEVIGTLNYAPHQHPLCEYDITLSHRGTFIMTHRSKTCFSGNSYTVTEYAPDGSFIRHLLTQENGVRMPYKISCDQQGHMWLTDVHLAKRQINIYKM